MAVRVSEEPIHSGSRAHPGQGQELRPKGGAGSLWWVLHSLTADMPLLALYTSHHPVRACGSPQVRASGTQGHLQKLPLTEHRWRHSKRRRLFLASRFGLLLPVPAETGRGPALPTLGTGAAPKENQQQPSLPAPRGFVPCYWQGQTSAVQR